MRKFRPSLLSWSISNLSHNVQAPKSHHDRAPYTFFSHVSRPRYIVDQQLRARCLPAAALEPAGMINGTFRTACRPLNVKWCARDIRQTRRLCEKRPRHREPPRDDACANVGVATGSRCLAYPGYTSLARRRGVIQRRVITP